MSGSVERVPLPWLRRVVKDVFCACGLSASAAATVTEALVDADLRGVTSHGTMLVPMYVDRLYAGSASRYEEAAVVADTGAVAVLDARHALGQLTGDQATGLAVGKAKRYGAGAVVVRRAFHFGAAARYVLRAVDAGCVGVAAANTRPLMPAPGGAEPVVGNNPVAVGVPSDGDPVVLDMALSAAALGKIRLAAANGDAVPDTWATDADGVPTTDPELALAGMLLPTAGHKGFGLAFMVDVLTGVLSGGAFGNRVRGLYADTSVPNDCAHLFLALDVESFGDVEAFRARVGELAASVRDGRRAPDVDRLFVPGQLEAERYAECVAAGSAPLDSSTVDALRRTAFAVGAALPEPGTEVSHG